jgi:hypothetical protein
MKYLFLLIAAFLAYSCSTSAPPPKTFSVDLNSPNYEAGDAEAYFDPFFAIGKLRKYPVNVYYYPNEDAVGLQFKVQYVDCNQFWDKAGRDAFVTAFKRYQEEYEQQKLTNKKNRDAYGTVQGFFTWKRSQISVQARGNTKIDIGYQFKDKAVFFTATQGETVNNDQISRSVNQTSPVMIMYFTRAQAESLAELFSQEYLQGLGKPAAGKSGGAAELDEY